MRGVTQISRPFQIALAAVALLGLVWVIALRGHAPGQHESTGAAPAPAQAPTAKAEAEAAAKPTPIYHGAAPGVEGLTRAIAKAHEAVGTSQRNAAELAQHSREASNEAASGSAGSGSAGAAHVSAAQAHAGALARSSAAAHAREVAARAQRLARQHAATDRRSIPHSGHAAGSPIGQHAAGNRPAAQVAVEREVAQSKTLLLLFWNSKSSVDREVRSETTAMVRSSKGTLALHVAAPNQVGEFGSLTEVVHVYQTPTILIVNRRGVVSTLSGLTDTFALRQLVHEAKRANR